MSIKLSVLFHPKAFWERKISGVTRYVCELGQGLIDLGVDLHIPIKDTPTEYLLNARYFGQTSAEAPVAPLWLRFAAAIGMKTKLRDKVRRFIRRWEGEMVMKKARFDLIHPTHNNSLEILKHLKDSALVVTVHDMTQELFPHSFAKHDPSAYRKKLFCERADRIIAISQRTKDDLVRICGISADKIDVVYHGNSLALPPDADSYKMETPQKYILFVGQRSGYKNFTRFAKSFAQVAQKHPGLELICAGGGSFTEHEHELLCDLGIDAISQQRWVTDEELALLYNRSLAFVYPSEYEGFGLPILEAFACRTPVLCSRASCFPEVAGDASLYFDPLSEEDMSHCMLRICESPELRQQLITKGIAQESCFSWKKCAEETLAVYRKAMS